MFLINKALKLCIKFCLFLTERVSWLGSVSLLKVRTSLSSAVFPTDCPVPTVVECPVSAALYHHATVYAGNAVIGLCGSGDEQQHIYTAAQTECRLMVLFQRASWVLLLVGGGIPDCFFGPFPQCLCVSLYRVSKQIISSADAAVWKPPPGSDTCSQSYISV